MAIKTAECTTCGWEYPVEDTVVLTDLDDHHDEREDIMTPSACPSPNMQWVVE